MPTGVNRATKRPDLQWGRNGVAPFGEEIAQNWSVCA
jgi:hypothetical protein